jgi:hypothetical protein
MTDDSFDPFDLPATFDPLAPVAPAPPRRRRLAAAAEAAHGPGAGGGAAGRLAHLLRPNPSEVANPPSVEDLQAQVAILTARLDSLETWLARRLGALP